MKPVSLADITYEQGLQLLELRKQALDSGTIKRASSEVLATSYPLRDEADHIVKSAAFNLGESFNKGIDSVKGTWKGLEPASRNVLTSGALGAGLGALTGVGASMYNEDDHLGRNMLMGGIAGGALGGGLGLATNQGAMDAMYDDASKALPDSVKYKEPEAEPAKPQPSYPWYSPTKYRDKATDAANEGIEAYKGMNVGDRAEAMNSANAGADTWWPEGRAVGQFAATGAAPAAGAAYLMGKKQFDPKLVAKHLFNAPEQYTQNSIESLIGKGQSLAGKSEEDIFNLLRRNRIRPGFAGGMGYKARGVMPLLMNRATGKASEKIVEKEVLERFIRSPKFLAIKGTPVGKKLLAAAAGLGLVFSGIAGTEQYRHDRANRYKSKLMRDGFNTSNREFLAK